MHLKNTQAQARNLLIICGPTATGKTKLGIYLAKKFNGEIISADSRQVYRFMDIGTGKEWGDAPIHGYDLIDPRENFSVSDFVRFATNKIIEIESRGKLPIIVGGTGLYIKAIVDGIETINIPSNKELRKTLDEKSAEELFEKLATLDSAKAASMNSSDKKNPRRLIRAIEVAIWKIDNESKIKNKSHKNKYRTLWIGLTTENNEKILATILKRVEKRIEQGFIDEVEDLLKMGVSWKTQSMKSLGYKESEGFFKSGLTYEDFVTAWIRAEFKYFKRQMTWFKKDKRINWFDTTNKNYYSKVENLVKRWDNTIDGQKS